MALNVLIQYLLQTGLTIGTIIIFGLLIALCNKAFYKNLGRAALPVCYVTGFIGTPIHECSHALFCLLFGHKIVEMKLFTLNDKEGALGYVRHTYNPKNIYQRAGNFFIGIAPILVISALLYLLLFLLCPGIVRSVKTIVSAIDTYGIKSVFSGMKQFFPELLSAFSNWRFWVFIAISAGPALHMNLSKADIQNALSGVIIVLIALFLINLIFYLCGAYKILISFMTSVILYLNFFFLLALILSFIIYLFSFIFRLKR